MRKSSTRKVGTTSGRHLVHSLDGVPPKCLCAAHPLAGYSRLETAQIPHTLRLRQSSAVALAGVSVATLDCLKVRHGLCVLFALHDANCSACGRGVSSAPSLNDSKEIA